MMWIIDISRSDTTGVAMAAVMAQALPRWWH
jgi:hypothetical protein